MYKSLQNSLFRLGHSIMTTLKWSTGLTIFLWCRILQRVSWTTRWRLPVSRWRTPSTFQQRPATTVWRGLRWFWTGWYSDWLIYLVFYNSSFHCRKVAHYMITYYLPSSLFVVVSWASFLIPSDDIQAIFGFWQIFVDEPMYTLQGRMALLITLFLVLVNIFNAITTNSPKADGLNALQAWVIACIFFIFGKDWI